MTTLLAPTQSAEEAQVRSEFASIPEAGVIAGTPQRCIERFNEYREAGVDTFLFTIPYDADSDYIHTAGQELLNAFDAAG